MRKPLESEVAHLREIGENDIADRIELRLEAMGRKEDWLVSCNTRLLMRSYDLRYYLDAYLNYFPLDVQKKIQEELDN